MGKEIIFGRGSVDRSPKTGCRGSMGILGGCQVNELLGKEHLR